MIVSTDNFEKDSFDHEDVDVDLQGGVRKARKRYVSRRVSLASVPSVMLPARFF
jgi:hypothetical protein